MDDWIVGIVKNGKVKELYLSDGLKDIDAIRALHRDCEVETMKVFPDAPSPVKTEKRITRRVLCQETNVVYESVYECSDTLGFSRWNIYKAIHRGTATGGFHFSFFD